VVDVGLLPVRTLVGASSSSTMDLSSWSPAPTEDVVVAGARSATLVAPSWLVAEARQGPCFRTTCDVAKHIAGSQCAHALRRLDDRSRRPISVRERARPRRSTGDDAGSLCPRRRTSLLFRARSIATATTLSGRWLDRHPRARPLRRGPVGGLPSCTDRGPPTKTRRSSSCAGGDPVASKGGEGRFSRGNGLVL